MDSRHEAASVHEWHQDEDTIKYFFTNHRLIVKLPDRPDDAIQKVKYIRKTRMIHVEVIYASTTKELVKIGPLWADFEITMLKKIKNKNLVAINCKIEILQWKWPKLLADAHEEPIITLMAPKDINIGNNHHPTIDNPKPDGGSSNDKPNG